VLLAVAVVSFKAIPVRPGEDASSVVLTVQPLTLVRTAVEIVDERELPVATLHHVHQLSDTRSEMLHPFAFAANIQRGRIEIGGKKEKDFCFFPIGRTEYI
jgi:hypothetical protein